MQACWLQLPAFVPQTLLVSKPVKQTSSQVQQGTERDKGPQLRADGHVAKTVTLISNHKIFDVIVIADIQKQP